MASLLYLIITFGILIGIHEWGHYQMARSLRVSVRSFSIFMGPKLFGWKSKKTGIDYKISLLPVGGYVSFINKADDDYDSFPEEVKKNAFDIAPLWKRALIVAAGPAMNFAIAFVLLFGAGMIGEYKRIPVITGIYQNSMAEKAGFAVDDRVLKVNDQKIRNVEQFATSLMAGTGSKLDIIVERAGKQKKIEFDLSEQTLSRDQNQFVTVRYGFGIPSSISLTINKTPDGYPAKEAGLQPGDKLLAVDDKRLVHFNDFVAAVQASEGKELAITFLRDDQEITKFLQAKKEGEKMLVGLSVGRNTEIDKYYILENRGIAESIEYAADMTAYYSQFVVTIVKKFISTDISLNMVSGPIGIAKAAEQSANVGIVAFLGFLALVSVNLGVMNLLPIPALDGGHLMFYAVEAIRRKPLNEQLQRRVMMAGIIFLLAFMANAVLMDFVYL